MRWPGVKLLTVLLKNQGPQVQGVILVSPMGTFLLAYFHPLLVLYLELTSALNWIDESDKL